MDCDNNMPKRAALPARRRKRGLLFRSEEGNALVELAFAIPMFMALIAGVGTFALALNNQLTLVRATTQGAEYLQALNKNSTSDPCKDTFNTIIAAAPGLNSSKIGITITLNGTQITSATTCSGDQSDLTSGGTVSVKTTYPCQLFFNWKWAASCQLSYGPLSEYEP